MKIYTVETGTKKYGSNMDCIEYNDIPMNEIADDLMNYNHWDYANVYGDFDLHVATIIKENGKPVIDWDWDVIC